MKKLLALLLVLLLAVPCAMAEDEELEDAVEMPEAAAVFEGIWACDRASMEIIWEEEGFRVLITWGSSATEMTEWEYNCFYHEEDHSVVSVMNNGTKTDFLYDENGEIVSSDIAYEDGEATFTLDEENHLIWKDAKEDAGKDMLFEYQGPIPPVDETV